MSILASIAAFFASLTSGPRPARPLKTDGQQIFNGFLAYYWPALVESPSALRRFIDKTVAAGFTGVTIELMEMMAGWPRGRRERDVADAMLGNAEAIEPLVIECRRAGLWLRIVLCNSNADVNRDVTSPTQITSAADLLRIKYGERNLILLPVSEQDSDLRAQHRDAIIRHVEATWSREHTISYGGPRPDAKWRETHMGHVDHRATGDWRLIAVSDTGSILRELHHDGVTGDRPRNDQWVRFAERNLTAGVSVCCYAFHRRPHYDLIDLIGNVARTRRL